MIGTNGLSSLPQVGSGLDVNEARRTRETQAGTVSAGSSVSAAGGKLDQASLSTTASLAAQGSGESDVRLEKVQQLQSAIAAGTYSVPASEVAGRLMDSLLKQD